MFRKISLKAAGDISRLLNLRKTDEILKRFYYSNSDNEILFVK